ncbi:hypothetical protein [Arthrobacter mobilis]|uniref:Uncharacterized protein n=1 Tax=Arthrobacter mobilis TaxID=2724944 RepID=A0A7X6HGW3_9MICC|nr:hypothetical protein [Arthrobacter mobilis]NKX55938.1 hypothetical protein [Arthrobacter mobilis]
MFGLYGRDDLCGFKFHEAWHPEDDVYVGIVTEYPALPWVVSAGWTPCAGWTA